MPPPQMAVLRNPCVYLSCRLHTRRTLTTPSLLRRSFSSSCRNLSSAGANNSSRPPTAPKPTPDIKHIRENASLYSENCIARNYHDLSRYPYEIQRLSTECRELQDTLREPQRKIKQIESAIAQLMANSSDPHNADPRVQQNQETKAKEELSALRLSAQHLKDKSHHLTTTRASHTKEIERLALSLPNLTSTETPPGAEPRIVNYINYDPDKPANLPTHTTSHVTIGTTLNLLNFTSASLTSGWGWYYLTNEAALLEQALIQFALSVAIRRGWQAVSPPSLVYSHIAHACGFQPRDAHNEQQIYHIEQSGVIWVAMPDPAGCWCWWNRYRHFPPPNTGWDGNSDNPLRRNPRAADRILTALNLPCRVLEMPAHDLGASAARKRDIEVLFPSRMASPSPHDGLSTSNATIAKDISVESGWGEVTSASNCTDYQTRRLGTRLKSDMAGGAGKFPHTVNGTAMAVPRIIAALLEHGWDENRGVVVLPDVLRGIGRATYFKFTINLPAVL
ncbi:seryl-tRNA synthetase [Histoplasma capsulatum G186AR]|uniref:Seryl-tRNA(Ser) synthetase n=1 Tax=Ajellomyces capsulatus (strain G186AR / H82 / ATCC MYA-2454 / RMSCC 2432) TaxID=447093 RepID=C0NLA2_AJECG|nr:seryl-tRNA synthetase [Histoplasma capsulatum G186AR]EEH08643.1 seryl-tRNA synthetase [Histoplasma capsulatum G186AR]